MVERRASRGVGTELAWIGTHLLLIASGVWLGYQGIVGIRYYMDPPERSAVARAADAICTQSIMNAQSMIKNPQEVKQTCLENTLNKHERKVAGEELAMDGALAVGGAAAGLVGSLRFMSRLLSFRSRRFRLG